MTRPKYQHLTFPEATGYVTFLQKIFSKTSDFPLCRGYIVKTTSFGFSRLCVAGSDLLFSPTLGDKTPEIKDAPQRIFYFIFLTTTEHDFL